MSSEVRSPDSDDSKVRTRTKLNGKIENIYRTLWRWHFYAGLIVAPILIWASVTGALYIFVDEIEPWLYRSMMFVSPESQRSSLEAQLNAVQRQFPQETVDSVAITNDPARTTEFFLRSESQRGRYVYVNPYRTTITGTRFHNEGFFPIVRMLHRTIYAGTFGRILMELSTSWGIILIGTGTYLWWPRKSSRKRGRWGGVWWPRFHSGTKTLLRDLHAVGGIFLAPVIIVIMVTGLFYTMFWGRAYLITMMASGGAPELFLTAPHSQQNGSPGPLSLDEVFQIAIAQDPDHFPISISLPHDTEGTFQINVGTAHDPLGRAMYAVDQYSGAVTLRTDATNASYMLLLLSYAYPLHVGSVFGIPTKLLALLACLMIVLLCVTGIWMWWRARPKGQSGLPGRVENARLKRWPVLVMIACGILMPMAGFSIIIVLLGDWIAQRFLR